MEHRLITQISNFWTLFALFLSRDTGSDLVNFSASLLRSDTQSQAIERIIFRQTSIKLGQRVVQGVAHKVAVVQATVYSLKVLEPPMQGL